MAFPPNWPPRVASGRRSIRFYQTGAATANYSDNAYLFIDGLGANTFTPLPDVKPGDVTPPGALPGTSPGTITTVPPTPQGTGINTPLPQSPSVSTPAMIWAGTIRVKAVGGPLTISFDGVNDHGFIPADGEVIYRARFEAGIAIKGTGTFHVEAW